MRQLNRDFIEAGAYWIVGRFTGLQLHHVLRRSAQDLPAVSPPEGMSLLLVRTPSERIALGPEIEEQLDARSGPSCARIIAQGGAIYALADGARVACQLNLRPRSVVVDSPADLNFSLADGVHFLDFLYTRDEYRGQRLAPMLVALACRDAAGRGAKSFVAHVRATNHASVRAFRKSGWKRGAAIISTRSGRFLGSPGCTRLGMQVRPFNSA